MRVPFGNLAAVAGVGFRALLSAGDVESRFRSPPVDGIDGQLGASLAVAPGWDARVALDYERDGVCSLQYMYSCSVHPQKKRPPSLRA
jgi:hypothetical protein